MSAASPAGRASLLTPPGRGAVAVIAAEGAGAHAAADAHFSAANGLRLSSQHIDRVLFGHWSDAVSDGDRVPHHRGEEVIVCRTSDSALEVHCHGGIAAADRILAAFAAHGCRIEPWAEWLRTRAASAHEGEADLALAAALTRRTAAILLDQRHGALQREIVSIIGALQSGEAAQLASARDSLTELCDRIPLGRHLTQPWQIAIAGRPNVGKSSLINALVGYDRAIVFDQPGTTRDVLAADTAIGGWPVRLTDSAGLRTTVDPLEAAGVELAYERLEQTDLVLWVLDAAMLSPADLGAPLDAAQREIAAELATPLAHEPLIVLNKADLVVNQPHLIAPLPASAVIATCALTGAGLPELLTAISHRLVPNVPAPNSAVPFAERHAVALNKSLEELDASNIAGAASALRALTPLS